MQRHARVIQLLDRALFDHNSYRYLSVRADTATIPPSGVSTESEKSDKPPNSSLSKHDKKATSAYYRSPLGSHLQLYGRDLTLDAEKGLLDPLIGREDVLERTLQILLRRTKNNPILIGDPGVGKTAIVEGLAQLMVSDHCPRALRGCSLVGVDISALVAGTSYRGSFEERLNGILNDVRNAAGKIILFVDEMHIMMDAGRVAEGGMNCANLLKPSLARGELHCIGATTVEEYRKHIETDAAFARRLQPVLVEEPSQKETLLWLQGLRKRYEAHHGVSFTDAAIATAVSAARRFVTERKLPDSAIDLLDEAAARVQLQTSARNVLSAPPLSNRFKNSKGKLDVDVAKERRHSLSCPHCGTPTPTPDEHVLTVSCPNCRYKFLNIAPEKLMLGSSLFLEKRKVDEEEVMDLLENDVDELEPATEVVSSSDILYVAARLTGLPAEKMPIILAEKEAVECLHEQLKVSVTGQSRAVAEVVTAIRLGSALASTGKQKRPICTLLLKGPRGTGKKTVCRSIASVLFGSEDAAIHFDMAQFSDRTASAKLVGTAAGFIGYGDGGMLSEQVKRHPHCIVIFENIEKAHHDIIALIRQISKEGFISDGMGRRIDFRNSILALTTAIQGEIPEENSSIDSSISIKAPQVGRVLPEPQREKTDTSEHATSSLEMAVGSSAHYAGQTPVLMSELLDTVDKYIQFDHLRPANLAKIAKMELEACQEIFASYGVEVSVSDQVFETFFLPTGPIINGNQARSMARSKILDPIIRRLGDITSLSKHHISGTLQTPRIVVDIDPNTKQVCTTLVYK